MTTTTRPEAHRTGSPRRQEANCFDFLRLLAALAVVVQHAVEHTDSHFLWYAPGSGRWFGDGVAVFFVISGGLVFSSALRCHESGRGWSEYFRNRLLRIAPAIHVYLVVVVGLLLLAGAVGTRSLAEPQFLAWAGSTLLLVPVYHPPLLADFGTGVVNGSLWTIPAEVGFYLIVPGLVLLAVRRSVRLMVVLTAVAAVLGCGLHAYLVGVDPDALLSRLVGVSVVPWLGYFLLGVILVRVWDRLPQSGPVALAALGGYAALTWAQHQVGASGRVLVAMLAAVPLAYLVYWVGHRGPRVLRGLTAQIGDLSFGAYIWHMPVINLLLWAGADHWPVRGTAMVLLVVAVTLTGAFASWHLVERPALRLKRYSVRGDVSRPA
ncbi:acyltransferase [Micromonospora zamorensis]|uniref:acyltransferase family protein n=1 Tax=Micromonospora zamorensis TaxID=709883 RepID=UPI002E16E9EC|nr:acyltransferase [Micromonospora zamorensis]WTE89611.1 acyltransferase [Micromonospora zamorensis]